MVTVDKIAYEKAVLRRQMLIVRQRIPNRPERTKSLTRSVLEHPKFQTAQVISIYISIRDEISTKLLIRQAWKLKKQVYVPMSGDDQELAVKAYYPGDALWPNSWGVPEPVTNESFALEKVPLELIIMPGLAFTAKGDRLGYGKGYYDRFMEKKPDVFTMGLTFKEQVLQTLPTNKKDYPVDALIIG